MEPSHEVEITPQRPEATAAWMFKEAGLKYPAASAFQGMYIAKLCTERGLDPARLGSALLRNIVLLAALTKTANVIHEKKEVKERGEPIARIEMERLIRIASKNFLVATEMRDVSEEQREAFFASFPSYKERVQSVGRNTAEKESLDSLNGFLGSSATPILETLKVADSLKLTHELLDSKWRPE